jgi:hypothetical protein
VDCARAHLPVDLNRARFDADHLDPGDIDAQDKSQVGHKVVRKEVRNVHGQSGGHLEMRRTRDFAISFLRVTLLFGLRFDYVLVLHGFA